MKLKPGPTRRVHANNTRGAAFCGLGAFVGVGKTQRAHVYTAATLPVGPDDYKKIDPEKLARELEVDKCAVNSGRFWMMDEVDYAGGDTVDFHGVKMNWAGDMTGAEMIAQFQSAYVPSLIQRNTNWILHAGKPVHLLREPDGTVWVLQEYTKAVDPSLTPDNLDTVGSKLKNLPAGWKFETKVLTENLSLDTGRSRRVGGDHSRRPGQHLSGLRLRQGHQRQLHPVTRRRGCKSRSARERDRASVRAQVGLARW